ncbi:MAG: hypothetical protein AB1589_31610, partial [Cyanobacteriota bacterium]
PGQGTEFIIQIPVQQANRNPSINIKAAPELQELQMLSSKDRQFCENQQQSLEIEDNSCNSALSVRACL